MKKEVHISGQLLYPLSVGNSARISRRGEMICTSPVVTIHEERDDFACFETENSLYRVSMQPKGVRMGSPLLLMCA